MEQLPFESEIEKISLNILKASKSYGVFPTPVDDIAKFTDLIIATGVDIKSLENKYKNYSFTETLRTGWAQIRGFLDRSQKVIYVDTDQIISRQNFVKLHETGHSVLPWQKSTLQFLDNDETLSPETKEEFEAEANFFASITLFQHDLFIGEMKKYELGIPAALQLAKHFGASSHATLRRFVEQSKKRCALLVLKDLTPKGKQVNGNFRDAFYSKSFLKEFGVINWPERFGYKWVFMQDHCFNKKMKLKGEINLPAEAGDQTFSYQFFNNSFNGFVFIFPKGENKKTRTKIILSESFL